MNRKTIFLSLLCYGATMTAQNASDSSDVFYKHLKLNELTVTGVTGQTKLRDMPAPVTLIRSKELRASVGTNIIDVVSHQPGMAQLTTGSGISKPIIRGLGYNRVLVVNDGVRQEGQQWGDEHGLEVDDQAVSSVEILKGPASLMYGSDAMAGVLILHSAPTLSEGHMRGSVTSGYQTNNGMFDYSLNFAGNQQGYVWNVRYSEKLAHEYKNPVDGYVPGTQLHDRAAALLLGINREWGHSHLKWDVFHLTPSMAEGERDPLTGELEHEYNLKTYHKALPFQQVKHYKATWDNALNLGKGELKTIIAYQQNKRQEFEDSSVDPELYFRLHTLTGDVRWVQNIDDYKVAAGVATMYQKSENLAEEALIPAYHLFDIGGYGTVQKTIGQWTMSGGLRADNRHIHDYGNFSGFTGSIGSVYRVIETADRSLNLRLNMARGFRAPNMSELGSDGVHEGTIRYEVGNKDLKSEYSWQGDLGIDYEGQMVSAQLSLFVNRIENYIFAHRIPLVMDPAYNTYSYTQGDAVLKGFETRVDFHPIHRIHFANSFSYVDGRQLHQPKSSRYLPMMPAPRWTSELKYEITHYEHHFTNSYVAVGMDCFLEQNHFYEADDTETRTPSYTLFNISAGTDLKLGGKKVAELYLTAQNLFNRAYQNHLSRLKYTDVNVVTGHQGIYNMGRNITFKVVVPIFM